MNTSEDPRLPPHSDNVEEELHRIQLALATVYNANSPTSSDGEWFAQRSLADRYLTSFQLTTISWIVCDRLLQENDEQRNFFAAQTLHTKCRNDITELPPSSIPSLRDSLLQYLQQAYSSKYQVTAYITRLALCISALAVQMDWHTILQDLLPQPFILPILQVLPEECASDRLLLTDESVRFRMRDHLVQSAPVVFLFLQQTQQHVALQVFHTWIRYVPVRPQTLAESPLLQTSVRALLHGSTELEVAADVVVEVLRMYPSDHPGNEGLVQLMIPLLSQLPLEQALQQDDEDVLRAYCRVVTEMGESYLSWILSPQYTQAAQLVQWVLKCSRIPVMDVASITLHFWYRLVMDLEGIDPYDWRQTLVDFYTPQLLELVTICVESLMRYPLELDMVPEDQLDDLHRHRFYVSETVEDCCRLLGGQVVLHRMNELLRKEMFQEQWQGIESCLACTVAIHRFVPSDESELLPLCFQLIPQLPPDIKPLRFTASKTIGKFASWLAMHSQLLEPLLPYLAQGLSIAECAPAAAVAIKELCECSNQTFAIAEPVLHLYQEIASQPGRLDLADELQILEGVCRALTRQIQDRGEQDGTVFLSRLVNPIGTRLAASVGDASTSPRRIISDIERVTVVVQYLTIPPPTAPGQQHPIVELMSSIWSFLDTATNRFPHDTLLAEKICRLHKHALRSTGARPYAAVLDHLIQQLIRSFDITRQSPYLYAASICITEYGHNRLYEAKLFEMVLAFATTVFGFLRSFEEMTNHPDVVEELFYLMERFIGHCPDPLIQSPLLVSLLQYAAVAMRLDHFGANKGTHKFLETTISYGLSLREQDKLASQSALEKALSQEGQVIVGNLAASMMGDLPSYSNQIPEILWKLNLLCPGLLAQWLTAAFDSAALPERAKNDFLGALDTGLARDEFSLAARAFQSACERERRFRKTQRRL